MQTYHVGLIALAFFAIIGLLVFWSWVSNIRKQEASIEPPHFIEGPASGQEALYVATTFAGRPLDRVVGHGLAHRGLATVEVDSTGVRIYRTGEKGFQILSSKLLGVSRTNAVIDRAVEKDGLVTIRWDLGGTEVETHLRFVVSSDRVTTLSKLADLGA